MMGWNISVYRQTDDGAAPAAMETPEGTRLAVWQTGCDGLGWLDALVKAGKAIALGGNGYPLRYTATAEYIVPRLVKEPPGANATWMCGQYDVISAGWAGKTVIDHAAVKACRSGEWLLVEAWDES